uniref:Uncharacterized protein n=1 Tax=Pithovirus LCDPAC01 TaxID=2506600 RepID=A0A481YMV0_9VIRU|nr:MAG: hypothetical protein LCDPAC01_01610 [Pithovirus LCDPAC01]
MFYRNRGKSNQDRNNYCTVGGENNSAGVSALGPNNHCTVSGGRDNVARESYSTVDGGNNNSSNAFGATVSGGVENTVFGPLALGASYSTIPGGTLNRITKIHGLKATVNHSGARVWSSGGTFVAPVETKS